MTGKTYQDEIQDYLDGKGGSRGVDAVAMAAAAEKLTTAELEQLKAGIGDQSFADPRLERASQEIRHAIGFAAVEEFFEPGELRPNVSKQPKGQEPEQQR